MGSPLNETRIIWVDSKAELFSGHFDIHRPQSYDMAAPVRPSVCTKGTRIKTLKVGNPNDIVGMRWEHKDPGRWVPTILLLHSWDSPLGVQFDRPSGSPKLRRHSHYQEGTVLSLRVQSTQT